MRKFYKYKKGDRFFIRGIARTKKYFDMFVGNDVVEISHVQTNIKKINITNMQTVTSPITFGNCKQEYIILHIKDSYFDIEVYRKKYRKQDI